MWLLRTDKDKDQAEADQVVKCGKQYGCPVSYFF